MDEVLLLPQLGREYPLIMDAINKLQEEGYFMIGDGTYKLYPPFGPTRMQIVAKMEEPYESSPSGEKH